MTYQDIANLLTSERCLNRVGMPFNRGQLHDMVKRAISDPAPRDREVA